MKSTHTTPQGVSIDIPTMHHPEFLSAEPADQGTWLLLIKAMQTHGLKGIIPRCRQWPREQWGWIVQVEPEQVLKLSPLWHFEGDDLHLDVIPQAMGGTPTPTPTPSPARATRPNPPCAPFSIIDYAPCTRCHIIFPAIAIPAEANPVGTIPPPVCPACATEHAPMIRAVRHRLAIHCGLAAG